MQAHHCQPGGSGVRFSVSIAATSGLLSDALLLRGILFLQMSG